jgi:GrpB-like predicted nucleotidyltransferase (UPF0157 family)
MDNNIEEADARFRSEAFRLRLREDLISLRVRYLRSGSPTNDDLEGLFKVHRELMQNIAALRVRRTSLAQPAHVPSGGLADSTVEVVAYNPAWVAVFEKESSKIRGSLGAYAVAVHHVGSTSVPGMPAKPIVDMAVAVDPAALRSNLSECIGAMKAIGYDYLGDWGHHGSHYFGKSSGTLRTSAVQLHASDSADLAALLAFRDAARSDPSLFRDYADTKVALASVLGKHRGLYVWCKGHWICDRILGDVDALAWGTMLLRLQHPTLVQMGFRGLLARLRPRFLGRGLHPMALRKPRATET